ncbi:MAG TPA: PilZ domain-containing protein [Terriglobales bacterium]|nr:PilZ domain-containing protein [Terriglobales bacterium]
MKFHALVVSTDSAATAVLSPVLAGFGMAVECCGYAEAAGHLAEQKFDAVVLDFDQPQPAALTLQNAGKASSRTPVAVALLTDKTQVRSVFGSGANFVLYKPISPEQAQASLRAATALIKRERRRALRVPVQVPVRLRVLKGPETEGILLDVSETGLEVLAAQPLCPSAAIDLQFALPRVQAPIQARSEVVWANPNGQSGLRFVSLPDAARNTLQTWVRANAAAIPPEELEALTACKLSDLSLGACYIETESPLPERSSVELRLKADDMEARALGMVRVMHPGFGMGIEFASSTPQEREQVRQFIEFLASRPGLDIELRVTPHALSTRQDSPQAQPATSEFEDPLLDLLRNHESLSQEEFLQQLSQQRGAPVGA